MSNEQELFWNLKIRTTTFGLEMVPNLGPNVSKMFTKET